MVIFICKFTFSIGFIYISSANSQLYTFLKLWTKKTSRSEGQRNKRNEVKIVFMKFNIEFTGAHIMRVH